METFNSDTSYPIETLPDDLHDAKPPREKWAIRDAMFWNDCQGWWIGHISEERQQLNFGQSIARFWRPLPSNPMTREEILAERGMVVCPGCDHACTNGHFCSCKAS